jgi:hypothetical protein
VIDNGSELFGKFTLPGQSNGFEALYRMTQPGGGYVAARAIDASFPIWSKLLLWEDRNHDGISQPDELQPVGNVLEGIAPGYGSWTKPDGDGRAIDDIRADQFGNAFRYSSWVQYRDEVKVSALQGTGRPGRFRQRPIWEVSLAGAR